MRTIKLIIPSFIGLALIFAPSTSSFAQRKKAARKRTAPVKKTEPVKETSVQPTSVVETTWEDEETGFWELKFQPEGRVIYTSYGLGSDEKDEILIGAYRQNDELVEMQFPMFKIRATLKDKKMVTKLVWLDGAEEETIFKKVK